MSETPPNTAHHSIVYGVPAGAEALYIQNTAENTHIHIALDEVAALRTLDMIGFCAPDIHVIYLPAWDCLPYDRVSPSAMIIGQRAEAMAHIASLDKDANKTVVVTTVNAALQKMAPPSHHDNARIHIAAKARVKTEDLQSFLVNNGYIRVDTVREPGEFAIRGDIIDLYQTGAEHPIRIDLFGDEVESIRQFDEVTQRTSTTLQNVTLVQAAECVLSDQAISTFRANYREAFGMPKDTDVLYEAIKSGRSYAGMEHWLPLFFKEDLVSLFDYLPAASISLGAQVEHARDERLAQVQDFYNARKRALGMEDKAGLAPYHPIAIDSLYIELAEWQSQLNDRDVVSLSPFAAPEAAGTVDFNVRKGRDFGDARAQDGVDVYAVAADHLKTLNQTDGRAVLVSGFSDGARDRLQTVLGEHGITQSETVSSWQAVQGLKSKAVGFITLGLEQGFEADTLAIVTEQDILGDRLARPVKKKRKRSSDQFLAEVSQLSEGDYVVHEEHGIGRFDKLETVTVMGVAHDCLKLTYNEGDRLFVPVENLEVLTRYGGSDLIVQLDRLGGAGWQARKARVKKDLLEMAEALLEIAAARLLKTTEVITPDATDYAKFAAGFPYMETDDQQNAIDDVLEDFEKGSAMDRLVCGDVGFGKTEIALRAAYVAAMAGYQVAIVAPTTLLVRQHYQEFTRRFKDFPVRVVQLSRLVKSTEAKRIKEDIKSGDAGIVIGTHALFGKTVGFNNLGLMIVDEEQRFGVKQKERLKEMQKNVHVLTLTATPIPRTLQMSLTGVKDLSIMATPPVDRLAVRTFVMPRDPVILQEALMREHFRGGQSFYVCPRIADLAENEEFLKSLVPELKIITAHGQMDGEELEDRIAAFIDGQYDILLATNIIESGIDIPNCNTMIIHRAEMFGLAQLYQLRGRIGRSKVRGYAYLTFDAQKRLTKQAEQRLQVLEQLNTLGAGFQLASHDMDIRGAGNILGEQQSGHIKEVGVELYHQMLEEAVAAVREGRAKTDDGDGEAQDSFVPQIELGMPVLIPERYVKDINVRLQLYRRLSDVVDDGEIDSFAAELVDRFGTMPDEVQNLLDVMSIKQLCRRAHIAKVEAGPKGAVLTFHENECPYVESLFAHIAENPGTIKLRPKDQKLVFIRVWPEDRHRVKGVRTILKTLVGLRGGTAVAA